MKRILVFLLIVLLCMVVSPAFAQEVTETPAATEAFVTNTPPPTEEVTVAPEPTAAPTLVPTAAPDPIVTDQVSFRLGLWGYLAGVITLILSGGGIGYVWGHTKGSKAAKDDLERMYHATSPDTQAKLDAAYEWGLSGWNRVDSLARDVLKLWREVSDGLPNVEGNPPAVPPTPPAT